MKVPQAAWLVWFYGPPIYGFKQGPFMEWRWTKTAANKRIKEITERGGGGAVLGCYERVSTSPRKGDGDVR